MASLANKTVVVLGASGQVGSGAVYGLVNLGATVIAPLRSEKAEATLKADIDFDKLANKANLTIVPLCDVGTTVGLGKLKEFLGATKVDHVISTIGGWYEPGPGLHDMSLDNFSHAITNQAQPHYMGYLALFPHLAPHASYTFILGMLGEIIPFKSSWSMISIAASTVYGIARSAMADAREVPDLDLRINALNIGHMIRRHAEVESGQGGGALSNRLIGEAMARFLATNDKKEQIIPLKQESDWDKL